MATVHATATPTTTHLYLTLVLPGRGEHDEVQAGEHKETGDDGDSEQTDHVGGGQHLGEGTRRVPRPPVPPADWRQTEAGDDRPHYGD